MCPVLNLQCQLTTNYFNLEFLSDFFFIISILLIYVYCCVFCYNRYFALCKSGDLFVYTENIYTRNLFTKSSRIFFFSWWSHASSITYICIVPGLCKSVGMRVILVEGQAIQEKKIELQASIFLEYLILSKVGEIFLKAFIRVRNCVENFFFILQQKDDVHEYCIASSWKIHGYDVNVPFNDHIHQCKLFQHTSSDIW